MSGGAHDHQRAMVKFLPGARAARLLALVLAAHALPCALPNPAASSSDHDPSAEQAEAATSAQAWFVPNLNPDGYEMNRRGNANNV